MDKVRLTPKAVADVDGIAAYTRREHGNRQCAAYLDDLEARFARLREIPVLERACDHVRPGLRCQRQGRHVVFYMHDGAGLIVRVLHERMDPGRHDLPEDDPERP